MPLEKGRIAGFAVLHLWGPAVFGLFEADLEGDS